MSSPIPVLDPAAAPGEPLCEACGKGEGYVFCQTCGQVLCSACDVEVHADVQHERVPVGDR
eukprot:m.126438 g.126438  ORF g.126438 m.126438 type:complete len:61 (-) comp14691_c1_seq1:599-781(-)